MKVKVLREFWADENLLTAGQIAELEDDVGQRVIDAGWAEADEPTWPQKVGSGMYQLSDGTQIKGKAEAVAAQKELDKTKSEDDLE